MEHIDLNENDSEGRLLELEPNQKIKYRLFISNISKGNYEITISSAADFSGIQKQEFTVN